MGWIVGGIILVLLAMTPIRLLIAYSLQDISIKLKVGFFTFTVLPRKEKTKQKKNDKPKRQASASGKKSAKTQKTSIQDYLPVLKHVLDLLARLHSKLIIRRLDFLLILAGDDPCDLAVQYGRAQGVFAALMAQLENGFRIRKRNVRIECDFTAQETILDGFADISISFGKLLFLAVKYGVLILRECFAIMNNKKAVQ